MKSKIVIGVIIFLLVGAGVVVGILCRKNSREFEIVQKTNGGVSLQWECIVEDTSIVEFVEKESEIPESDKDLDGGRVYEHFKFKTLKEGVTTITFNYNSVGHDGVAETKKYKVVVDSKLNSKVTEIKD